MIRQAKCRLIFLCLLAFAGSHSAIAATTHNEGVHGDLSNDRLNPTPLLLAAGVNSLAATMGSSSAGYDIDYLRIDLPMQHRLEAILLQSYSATGGFDGSAFVGLQAGSTFTFQPADAISNINNMLGWAHFGPDNGHNSGDDILQDIGMGGQGFAGSLSEPIYTLWFQQTGSLTSYQLEFVVSAIPEPSPLLLVLIGTLAGVAKARHLVSSNQVF